MRISDRPRDLKDSDVTRFRGNDDLKDSGVMHFRAPFLMHND
jgi:hypothetical protein